MLLWNCSLVDDAVIRGGWFVRRYLGHSEEKQDKKNYKNGEVHADGGASGHI
ncbi:MAG: hypothetical protein IT422_15265 [Pirellulaceae bacterium]|nr:hypothetical protein [Pirellulaceae bacterium]